MSVGRSRQNKGPTPFGVEPSASNCEERRLSPFAVSEVASLYGTPEQYVLGKVLVSFGAKPWLLSKDTHPRFSGMNGLCWFKGPTD